MGAWWTKMFSRDRVQPQKIKSVWDAYISVTPHYFHKVIRNVCARDEGIRDTLLSSSAMHAVNEDEKDFVLTLIGDRIAGFFHCLIQDECLYNVTELKKQCYNMGRQHATYSNDTFKLVWWDEFTLAMLEELEDSGKIGREDLRSWQTLLHIVNENMLLGYHDARSNISSKNRDTI